MPAHFCTTSRSEAKVGNSSGDFNQISRGLIQSGRHRRFLDGQEIIAMAAVSLGRGSAPTEQRLVGPGAFGAANSRLSLRSGRATQIEPPDMAPSHPLDSASATARTRAS